MLLTEAFQETFVRKWCETNLPEWLRHDHTSRTSRHPQGGVELHVSFATGEHERGYHSLVLALPRNLAPNDAEGLASHMRRQLDTFVSVVTQRKAELEANPPAAKAHAAPATSDAGSSQHASLPSGDGVPPPAAPDRAPKQKRHPASAKTA